MTLGPQDKTLARPSFIYVLIDPETLGERYVGKTVQPLAKRLKQHLDHAARAGKNWHRDNWIRSLQSRGLVPLIATVESGEWTVDQADMLERAWIKGLRGLGEDLTNIGPGGEGNKGAQFSAEARRIIGEKSRAYRARATPEQNAKRLAAWRETWQPATEYLKADWANPESKRRKTFASDEYRQRRSELSRNWFNSAEGRLAVSAGARAQHAKRRQCQTCGLVTSPAPMGNHLKSSHHHGFIDLPVEEGS